MAERTQPALRIGSLFSGIGGLELGLERAGVGRVVWQCEIDPFCRRVLAKHWPDVTRFQDVTQPRNYPHVDVICGGFPCQDVSSAGHARGLSGARSGLWFHFADVIARVAPAFVVVENVASGEQRWLPAVRRHLSGLGYKSAAISVSAADVAAPHLRRRTFVVAHSHRVMGKARHRDLKDGPGAVLDGGAPGDAARVRWPLPPTLSDVGGVGDGIPDRLDRLRALGNAVVPQCAEVIGRVIQEMRYAA